MFQSRSGFSVRCDSRHHPGRRWPYLVSIPVWVFGPSRRDEVQRVSKTYDVVSIPVWVFGPSRHVGSIFVVPHSAGFQSRSGFSVRRDPSRGVRVLHSHRVSIPVWVFGPSRRERSHSGHAMTVRFNPGLGFRSVATYAEVWGIHKSSFNPGLGFRSVAT